LRRHKMIRFIFGLGFFGLAICLVFGIIHVNLWSIGALFLCLAIVIRG
jgi:hypothetical protein